MAADNSRSSKSRLERIHRKFQTSVENGQYYEASQMTKTLYFRYKSQKKYDDAENLLYESTLTLLRHAQIESGFELAKTLINLYKEIEKPIDDFSIEKIKAIIESANNLPQSALDFIQQSLDWTTNNFKHGHPKVHEAAATKLWEVKEYTQARKHIVYVNDGSKCASFLIEYHVVCGFPGEVDLFVTQAVLQILCLRNTNTATAIFFAYTLNHPGIRRKTQPYRQPLLNFIAFLLLIIERGNVEQYSVLCEQYKPSIQRDPTYLQYLDRIGQLFFGLPPPQKKNVGFQGVINDLMESIFTGGGGASASHADDVDDDDEFMEIGEDVD